MRQTSPIIDSMAIDYIYVCQEHTMEMSVLYLQSMLNFTVVTKIIILPYPHLQL